jgi:hypothetical protein
LHTPRAIAGIMLSSDAKINEDRKGGWGLPHLCVWFIEVILLIMASFSGNYVQPGPTVENSDYTQNRGLMVDYSGCRSRSTRGVFPAPSSSHQRYVFGPPPGCSYAVEQFIIS